MAKNKTTETEINVFDFVNAYVDNEQKKTDSFRLIELMQEWSGFEQSMKYTKEHPESACR